MKKMYSKPTLEIEVYEMSADFAANCGTVVTLGPEATGITPCAEFKKGFGDDDDFGLYSLRNSAGKPFYSDGSANCDCYYSSGGGTYFTS